MICPFGPRVTGGATAFTGLGHGPSDRNGLAAIFRDWRSGQSCLGRRAGILRMGSHGGLQFVLVVPPMSPVRSGASDHHRRTAGR
jgi:hypothetical protein